MQAKRSYSGVLAAAAATAFSPHPHAADAGAAEPLAVNEADQISDDAAITARVKAALAAAQLLGRVIQVSVTQGVVRLVGLVESEHDLRLAELNAKSVPGVSKVDNEIELNAAPAPGPF